MENKGNVLMQKYEIGRLLGQGTFAKVHHARNLKTGMSVAIKMIDKEKVLKVGMMDQIKREISVMRLIRHPNVVELYEVMATKTKIYFVMEYIKGGELFTKVAKGKLKEDVARKYFQQLISAVDYCHSRGVSHRDLKPENLLLDENENLKVSDFGLSALSESKRQDGLLHTTCGTPAYVAPEVIKRKGYDGAKADIWSCGVILYVLLAGYLPFRDPNLMEMYRKIGKGEFKCPNWFAPEVRKLMSKILDPKPNTRISMAKIMENSWVRKGLQPRPCVLEAEVKEPTPLDSEDVFGINESSCTTVEPKQESAKPCNLNAFDIISYSAGFDLSGLFEEKEQKKEVRFTSNKPASTIISKLEDIAKRLKLKIMKNDGGLLKIEGSKEGRKGVMGIDAEIFEITPFFHLVEMKKSSGDTVEYQKVVKQDIRPALKDIVWSWQGEQQRQQLQLQEQQDLQPSQKAAKMVFALSSSNASTALQSLTSSYSSDRPHLRPSNLLLPRHSLATSTFAFSRRRNHNSPVTSSSKKKKKSVSKKEVKEEDETDEDAFEALFGMLEEDLKSDDLSMGDGDDEDGDLSEKDLEKLQRELEEALGVGGDDDDEIEMVSSVGDDVQYDDGDEEEEEEEERPVTLKNWQLRRLARVLKIGRRKTSIKSLAGELCLDRAVVLDLLRDPPPNLVMMSATLPDEPVPTLVMPESKPSEIVPEETRNENDVKSESEVKVPVHVMQDSWFARKRLKKVHVDTLEKVYRRTKRPTNTMISSIVHVTNLPRKRVVKWFEDKRAEDGVPVHRNPFRRSVPETVSSS